MMKKMKMKMIKKIPIMKKNTKNIKVMKRKIKKLIDYRKS
jgi:hypothetical protein